jgi:predicted O-methyltransferase YrrM
VIEGSLEFENWIEQRLIRSDPALVAAASGSEERGLPPIQVDPPMGKLLSLLVRMVSAQRVLEIGTLGGYSTIWMARALPDDGELVTLEFRPEYAEVARENIARAELSDRVDIRVGPALDTLPTVTGPFDLVFIDADKNNQDRYLAWALELTRVGSVIVGDNIVRGGRTLLEPDDEGSQGITRFVDLMSVDPRLDATVIQTVSSKSWDGFAVALVVEPS